MHLLTFSLITFRLKERSHILSHARQIPVHLVVARRDCTLSIMHRPSSFSVALLFQSLLLPAAATPPSNQQQPIGVPGSHFGLPAQNATFDYVVVGGGTGGLAIAYRLAENGKYSVAVIEAGGFYEVENGNTSVVPAYNQDYNYITPDSQWDAPLVDWGFLTSPQAGAMGQRFHYGRGKMLGGW